MSAPIWITPAGSLGTIQEQVFFQLEMRAYDPDNPEDSDLSYKIVAGQLPPGLVMYENGTIQGNPKELYYLRGVPFDVKQDMTSTWCCRATNNRTGELTDRTYSLTVTGEDPPVIITEGGELGKFIDGQYVSIQLAAIDLDNEPIAWEISKGSLPPGLSLNTSTGLITGFAEPAELADINDKVGWSAEAAWDEYPWDFGSRAISTSYGFTVQVTDGKMYDAKRYTIFVYSRNNFTADTEFISADETDPVTADADSRRLPILVSTDTDLGTYVHDNYYAYRFVGKDYDNEQLAFELILGVGQAIPPGLQLNPDTGWLYGYLPTQVPAQIDYEFGIRVYKKDYPTYASPVRNFTLAIVNDLRNAVTWITAKDLGSMDTGSISEKHVEATNAMGRSMNYTLESGKLPQGLRILGNGLIAGRSSFEITSFDRGSTTFDQNVRELGVLVGEMTFDHVYTFTVKASDANGEIVGYKTFTITVVQGSYGPYESLYLRAQPGYEDKRTINGIFNNSDIIPVTSIYREGDPNFGRSKDLRMLLISGLTAGTPGEYMDLMATNHYRKVLGLGEYSWAQALNDDGSVAYEVVYIPLHDDLSRNGTTTISQSLDLSRTISYSPSSDLVVHPNSLLNMRKIMRDGLGLEVKEPLPRWMTSKQPNGRIPGWTPAAVVVYVKPGEAQRIVFNLNRLSTVDIKTVSFDVDRYIWDGNLSKNYDASTNTFDDSIETTFDALVPLSQDPVAIVDFALDVPFSYINRNSTQGINALGGLDGIIKSYENSTVVFAAQENYEGFTGEYDGWVDYQSPWDTNLGWDEDIYGWDSYSVIPGYLENLATSVANERSGVWKIVAGDDDDWRLELILTVDPGEVVQVRDGFKYNGYTLMYGPTIDFINGDTVPKYNKYEEVVKAEETTFDNRATRFFDSISVYQEPDADDKYLAFPRVNIWA